MLDFLGFSVSLTGLCKILISLSLSLCFKEVRQGFSEVKPEVQTAIPPQQCRGKCTNTFLVAVLYIVPHIPPGILILQPKIYWLLKQRGLFGIKKGVFVSSCLPYYQNSFGASWQMSLYM